MTDSDTDCDSDLTVGVSPWARSAWTVAYAPLVLALLWVPVSWAHLLVVVESTVVPLWVAGPALVITGTALRVGLRVFGVPKPGLHTWWLWVQMTVTVLAWVLVLLAAAYDVYDAPSYVVVPSPGSGGCRLVVEERSFLFAGSGSVHVAGQWGPFAPQVGSYTTDDGERPVSSGSYSVVWDSPSRGVLEAGPTLTGGDSEQGSGRFTFDC